MKTSILKTAAILGVSLFGFTGIAGAVPPPDVVKKCQGGAYQMHHWNMLYGGPQTIYYQVGNYANPNGPWYFTQITHLQYIKNCPLVAPRPLLQHYQAVKDFGDLVVKPTPVKPMKELRRAKEPK